MMQQDLATLIDSPSRGSDDTWKTCLHLRTDVRPALGARHTNMLHEEDTPELAGGKQTNTWSNNTRYMIGMILDL